MGHSSFYLDAGVGDIGELQGIVGLRENCLGEVLPNLVFVDVKCSDDFDIFDSVIPDLVVHHAGDIFVLRQLDVLVDALHQG